MHPDKMVKILKGIGVNAPTRIAASPCLVNKAVAESYHFRFMILFKTRLPEALPIPYPIGVPIKHPTKPIEASQIARSGLKALKDSCEKSAGIGKMIASIMACMNNPISPKLRKKSIRTFPLCLAGQAAPKLHDLANQSQVRTHSFHSIPLSYHVNVRISCLKKDAFRLETIMNLDLGLDTNSRSNIVDIV